MDELSAEFGLPIYNCIEILKHMLSQNDICGVLSDDGHFTYVKESDIKKLTSQVIQQKVISTADVKNLFC